MKREIVSVFLFAAYFLISSCSKTKHADVPFFQRLNSPYNLLNLQKTDLYYKGGVIYTLNVPYPGNHKEFIRTNYLWIDSQRIFTVSLYSNCMPNYKIHNYNIFDKPKPNQPFDYCGLYFFPYADFTIKVNDTIKYFDHWTRLDKKFYDEIIKDTIYKFRYNVIKRTLDQLQTITYIGRNVGIVGILDTSLIYPDTGMYVNQMGVTYKKQIGEKVNLKIRKPEIPLESITEFHR